MAQPLESYWTVVNRILRYLKWAIFHGLPLTSTTFGCHFPLQACCDAD